MDVFWRAKDQNHGFMAKYLKKYSFVIEIEIRAITTRVKKINIEFL